ncbi:DUF3898 domain-containing protein [Cytobacillus pseudoceanisediminis]
MELKLKDGQRIRDRAHSDFRETIPIAKVNGRYVLLIESGSIKFKKAFHY